MKKTRMLMLSGIILFLLIPIFALSQTKDKGILIDMLEDMGADFLEGEISIGGVIKQGTINEEEAREIIKGIKNKMEIEDGKGYKESIKGEDGEIQVMGQGYDRYKNQIVFTISSYKGMDNSNGETFLFINCIKKEQFIEFNDIIGRMENLYGENNKTIDITTCVIGSFDGQFNLNKNKKRILKANRLVRGNIIEHYEDEDENILSYSIFTPYIDEHIYTGDRKMNLNIAAGYNEEENKTYIWIGTPIITVGY